MKSARYHLEHHAIVHPGHLPDFFLYYHSDTPSRALRIAHDVAARLNCALDFVDAHLGTASVINPPLAALDTGAQLARDISQPPFPGTHSTQFPFRRW